MAELRGTGVGRGVAAGRVVLLPPPAAMPLPATAAQDEPERAMKALSSVAAELGRRAECAGQAGAEVLAAQAMMATDPMLEREILSLVDTGIPAARAISDALDGHIRRFLAAGGQLAARAADLEDIKRRAVAECLGLPQPGLPQPGYPYVLVAKDLAPADTATLDSRVLALITVEGGPTSHTAILARAMGIPAVVGCAEALSLVDGERVTVDAARGLVRRTATADSAPTTTMLSAGIAGPGRTADGHPILLQANIGSAADITAAVAAGAEGVGLLRTEFFDDYGKVFAAFAGQRVVVRAYDTGGDKGLSRPAEPNPALGVRGIRALIETAGVLDAQLRAIAAAAAEHDADVWVLAPMVGDAAEAEWFAARARSFGLPTAGAMIEVPAAALMAESILSEVDFASIGTNDLVQFTLAADRQLGALARLQDPWHPAVLRLIAVAARASAATGRPIGVCGEAAADPRLACVLAGLGVSSLSMAPAALADVRAELAQHTLAQCQAMAARLV